MSGQLLESAPLAVRPATIDDAPYILDSWKTSYRRHLRKHVHRRLCPSAIYWAVMNDVTAKLVAESQALLAVDPDDTDYIVAWVCFDSKHVHYCYTKGPFRRLGVQDELWAMMGGPRKYASFFTEPGIRLITKNNLTVRQKHAFGSSNGKDTTSKHQVSPSTFRRGTARGVF